MGARNARTFFVANRLCVSFFRSPSGVCVFVEQAALLLGEFTEVVFERADCYCLL
jgi:hypothetical protein